MGNCVACGGTTVAAGGCGRRGENRKRRRMSWEAPREDQLGMVPGRIFSNDGRSRTASLFTQKGRRAGININQDAMLVWDGFGGEDDGVLCGVFDGHGPHGNFVSRRVRDALPLKLMSAALAPCKNGLDMPVAAWRKAFKRAYKAMDKDLCSPPSLDYFDSGSTAVTVLKLGSDIYIANIGDSRAVLGSRDGGGMVAVKLTDDLKPDVPSEAERIKKCGGRVSGLQEGMDVPRVWPPFDDNLGLAMTRAFGDFCLKDYGVISVPDFFHWSLTEKDQFVILASDGVWDVLSNQEAVDIVSSSSSRSKAAKSLVEAGSSYL